MNFDALGDRQGLERPWDLDLLPLPISPSDFELVERGLQQRCRLLDALLADCYGPRRLVKDRVIPASVMYANPAFLYPASDTRPVGARHLILAAADLGRTPQGEWFVLDDHTQAPSGTGYALENRLVLLRVLPEEFRTCQVRRLAAYFQYQRDTLSGLAANPVQPNVVVLTPGPSSPHYFEHAYLARYLALPLVEGTDLTARQSRIFLKTLEGLQPIDVILRHTVDAQADPLELGDSALHGVPGLLEAVRSGTIAIVNPIGSGLAEAPAWMAFLSQICEHLLQEPLRLSSVPSWWCGQSDALRYVLENLEQLSLRYAFSSDAEPVSFGQLNGTQKDVLVKELQRCPHEFVAQENLQLSHAPVWLSNQAKPHPLVLRSFVCFGPQGVQVMPGGLTRVLSADASPVSASRSGGASKDTWVISETPVAPVRLVRTPATAVRLERAAAEVPSRVADNLFWLGRYSERLEDLSRTLRCVLSRLVGEASFEKTPDLLGLVRILVYLELLPERFAEDFQVHALARETHALLYETHRLGTLPELLGRLHRIAWNVRDRLSADTWRTLNQLHNDARPSNRHQSLAESLSLLSGLIADLAALAGLEMENMSRGHGWRFLQLGRRLERAANIATLGLAGLQADAEGFRVLEPMLEIADSTMTYRRLYFAQPLLAGVLDLLLADESNPRGLAFQLLSLRDHGASLPQPALADPSHPVHVSIADACELLQAASFDRLDPIIPEARRQELHQALRQISELLPRISNGITHRFFNHAETRVS
jgi:uncharacterized circularly permuted ATP-grasp superfamily protein/uncharacterized alpha-E superfamily protein